VSSQWPSVPKTRPARPNPGSVPRNAAEGPSRSRAVLATRRPRGDRCASRCLRGPGICHPVRLDGADLARLRWLRQRPRARRQADLPVPSASAGGHRGFCRSGQLAQQRAARDPPPKSVRAGHGAFVWPTVGPALDVRRLRHGTGGPACRPSTVVVVANQRSRARSAPSSRTGWQIPGHEGSEKHSDHREGDDGQTAGSGWALGRVLGTEPGSGALGESSGTEGHCELTNASRGQVSRHQAQRASVLPASAGVADDFAVAQPDDADRRARRSPPRG